ncbi:hypothetical protein B8V81_3181 [Paenibacillus pasadenensis]|uniref:Uncharacterized protein n=1 Tax=Paenibacillus pasadenensis TaxID=217090 RepID=A0A2N5N361_9BACL|nr:hypothetical protein [Paenibacillus pasadenensis]PLT44750.1 hypothetical protein B8V81_3181 [Paenibacillus pasadenensis]
MKEFLSIRLLDRFRGAFTRAGYDFPALRVILQAKLTMGRRRPTGLMNAFSGTRKTEGDELQNSFFSSLWIYVGISLFLVPMAVFLEQPILRMGMLSAVQMLLLSSLLLSDFSTTLLDTRDRTILGVRPVSPKTAGMARLLHAAVYLGWTVSALTALPLLAALLAHGPASAAVYAVHAALQAALLMSLTAAVYYGVLRLWDGERLKDMINYVQIFLAAVVLGGSQLAVRLFNFSLAEQALQAQWWWTLVPPLWFAAPHGLIDGQGGGWLIACTVLSVAAPLLGLLLYLRLLPSFERSLHKLASKDAPDRPRQRRRRMPMASLLGRLLLRDPRERALLDFSLASLSRERDFKLKVYPSLGYAVLIPVLFVLPTLSGNEFRTDELSPNWSLALYGTGLAVPMLLLMLRFSSRPLAAWIFHAAPGLRAGQVHRAAAAAVLLRLGLPALAVPTLLFLAFFGTAILPHLAGLIPALSIFAVIGYRVIPRRLPFAEPFPTGNNVGGAGHTFLLMFLLLGLGLLHALIANLAGPVGLWLYAVLLLAGQHFSWKYGFREGAAEKKAPANGNPTFRA